MEWVTNAATRAGTTPDPCIHAGPSHEEKQYGDQRHQAQCKEAGHERRTFAGGRKHAQCCGGNSETPRVVDGGSLPFDS
jgi:hypothetical protein